MAIVGIDSSNIAAKRTLAQQRTANLGPLVLCTKEARDVTYNVPSEKLGMPTGPATADATTYNKLSEIVTTTEMDRQGNVTRMAVQTLDGAGAILQTQTTVNNYLPGTALPPDATNNDGARFGRLSKATVTTARPGLTDQTRVADFAYYGYSGASCAGDAKLRGLLCMEKVTVSNLGGSDAPEITQHFYDAVGNKIVTRAGSRVSPLAEYDTKGRYVQATYDVFRAEAGAGASVYPTSLPAGAMVFKTNEVLTRDKFGNALSSRTAIGSGNWLYGVQAATPMGTIYFKGDSTGASEETRMQRTLLTNANWCPLGTKYVSMVTKSGGAKGTQCFDSVGRNIGGYVVGFGGEIIRTRKDYDVLGRVIKVFEPAKNAAPSLFTSTDYDVLGRPIAVTHPFYRTNIAGVKSTSQIAMTRFEYAGFNTKTIVSGHTDSGVVDRTKEEFRNALGELTKVTEMGSRSIDYRYDVLGNLTKTIDPAGNEVVIGYNGLGQKVSMNDPDKGIWSYRYNAFGEITTQIDAAGTSTITTYDFKGRKEGQTLMSSGASGEEYFLTWEYDLAENGLGQVFRESKNNGQTFAREFTRVTSFDNFGRPSITTTTFQGAGTTQESHYQKVAYDKFGRVHQTFDAARAGPQFTYNGVQNLYNEYGYLAKVQDAANGGSAPFYTVNAMDARGNVVDMTYGSGDRITYMYDAKTGFLEEIKRQLGSDQTTIKHYNATWDHLGNLVKRDQDFLGDLPETFAYDNYNRLVSNTLDGTTKAVSYNNIDNITSKTAEIGNELIPYTYHSTKKHAITKVGNRSFEYDANGNVTRELVGTTTRKNITYTLNDLVKKIEVVGTNAHTSEFFYDSSNTRYKRIDRDSSGRVTTTLYLDNVEKVHNSDNSVQWKRQIGGVAQMTHAVTSSSVGTGTRRYFHMDHLGSINVITSSAGVIEHRMAFDPWGARRIVNSSGVWQASNMTHASILSSYAKTVKPVTNRGYTGHEMLDEVGIIHMNGRIYDAYLARFLQADPFIQDPTAIASLNRYSYVMNNPLNAVDPTGFISLNPHEHLKKKGRKAIRSAAKIFGEDVVNYAGSMVASYFGGAWGAALWSYEFARAMGASSSEARKGAAISLVSSAAYYYIGGNIQNPYARAFANGMVGGVSSVLQGGKFGHGFVSAGASTFVNVNGWYGSNQGFQHTLARVTIAAVIGGTISEATGGKFANGARTAAMAQLFSGERDAARENAQRGGGAGDSGQARNPLNVVVDVVGKIWNLPNTLLGLVYGGVGHVVGWITGTNPYITFKNNAIQFHNNPFTTTAMTLGNTILYNPAPQYQSGAKIGGHTLGYEEMQHTYQGQVLGPLYLFGHFALGTAAMIIGNDYSIEGWHGPVNFLENCPHKPVPSPWSC